MKDFTGFNIDEVYRMPAQDFFLYLEFINERNRRKYIQQRQEMAKQKAAMKKRH